jgi:hypothetical protein
MATIATLYFSPSLAPPNLLPSSSAILLNVLGLEMMRRPLAVSLLLLACIAGLVGAGVTSAVSAEAFVSPDTAGSAASGPGGQSKAPPDYMGSVSFCTSFFGS